MANNQVSFVIRARDMASRAFKSVTDGLKRTADAARQLARRAAQSIAALGAGIAAMAAVAIREFAKKEQAAKALEGALIGLGKSRAEIDALAKSTQKLAQAIQNETGVADDQTVATVAQLHQLGLLEDQMDQAARAVVGLAAVGMGQAQATRAVAAALQGEYTMLQRYVPALRMATTETEKARIVNELFSRTYQQQRSELESVSRGFAALRGRVGDFAAQIGRAIAEGTQLGAWLAETGNRIRDFGDSPTFQAFLVRLQNSVELIKRVFEAVTSGREGAKETLVALGAVLSAALREGANVATQTLMRYAPVIGNLLGDAARRAMAGITERAADRSVARQQARQLGLGGDERERFIEEQTRALQQMRLEQAGEQAAASVKQSGETLSDAIANLRNVVDKHAPEMERAVAAATDAPIEFDVATKAQAVRDRAEREAIEAAIREREEMANVLKAELNEQQKIAKGWQDEADAIEQAINKRKEALEAQQRLAQMRVQDILAERKAEKDAAKEREQEETRAARLEAAAGRRGVSLSRQDQEWLDAFRAREAAEQAAKAAPDQIAVMKEQMNDAKENADAINKTLGDGFRSLNQLLERNLAAPEG